MRFDKGLLIVLLLAFQALAEQLKPATVAAFDQYVSGTEQRMANEVNSGGFLWIDMAPPEQRDQYYARLHKGEVLTKHLQTLEDGRAISVTGGMIHHWVGLVFIPGASLANTVAFLQDYDQQYKFYAPEVEQSRLVRRNGNDFHVYLRLRRKKVVTVVLDTEYDAQYTILGNNRANARSYSTRIAEVEHAGGANETEKPVGNDSGFLWRLNSYWRLSQRDGGTYVQLEAILLTRDIPAGLGWLIRPFVSSVPQESLQFTLSRTRTTLCCTRRLQAVDRASSARITSRRKPNCAEFKP
ncbi:MAG TPA: hypothetical protein VMT53_14250 [Terriglobales bacterium]|nr:hypothetical protein [Terriglobales bacterium]